METNEPAVAPYLYILLYLRALQVYFQSTPPTQRSVREHCHLTSKHMWYFCCSFRRETIAFSWKKRALNAEFACASILVVLVSIS